MNSERLQSWLLRLFGSIEILAFFAVVMPRSWMEVTHASLGLGEMPGGPIIMFMIRQASYVYGMHGLLLWILAWDVIRFRPLVIFTGASYLLSAPVFFLIDYSSGMPWFWTISDTVGGALVGGALLFLSLRGARRTQEVTNLGRSV